MMIYRDYVINGDQYIDQNYSPAFSVSNVYKRYLERPSRIEGFKRVEDHAGRFGWLITNKNARRKNVLHWLASKLPK